MKLKDFRLAIIGCLFFVSGIAQKTIFGVLTDINNKPLHSVEIYDAKAGWLAKTNLKGEYSFITEKSTITLVFYLSDYEILEKSIVVSNTNLEVNVQLSRYSEKLPEVIITAQKKRVFNLKRLRDVEETAIYAGKKTEVILVEQSLANLASNNARQIYNQVAGLNIYQNDDAGLQLNIGGRGLDPNRTSNFNTRQNSYDISADVLGYPESYYTPPAEALEEIQVVRGAASLQYGTQFGGLINFKFKKPKANDPFELITRNTAGSNGLYTNFTSINGTANAFSYYAFYNYKRGDGFRPNSEFESNNAHVHLGYQLGDKTKLTGEITFLNYLAQQAGGLTDTMFDEDPFQSNRTRNWFEVNWLLYNLKLSHQFSEKTNFTFSIFGLDAQRKALGYRGDYKRPQLNPVKTSDELFNNEYELRDLIDGRYKNFGFETRLLSKYTLIGRESTFLIGAKYYNANNSDRQGAGTRGAEADFKFVETNDYISSSFELPNKNIAIFGENIFRISNHFTVTPGARFEYIKTSAKGEYTQINRDGAGNSISNNLYTDDKTNERSFMLLGIGLSYKPFDSGIEMYANISQNYRSVTFSDIRTVNPTFNVDENIFDEEGKTVDIGVRGRISNFLNYDVSSYGLFYNDRIGIITEKEGPNKGDRLRTNIGDAIILGLESVIEINVLPIFEIETKNYSLNLFNNLAITKTEYTKSLRADIAGKNKKVEFVPEVNLKSGLRFGYKNFLTHIQFTHLSDQFTDATNSLADIGGEREGVVGKVPAYSLLDFSFSYKYRNFKLEAGLNNVLDTKYFTRRATGYPGPGIIPSPARNWYTTLQIKL